MITFLTAPGAIQRETNLLTTWPLKKEPTNRTLGARLAKLAQIVNDFFRTLHPVLDEAIDNDGDESPNYQVSSNELKRDLQEFQGVLRAEFQKKLSKRRHFKSSEKLRYWQSQQAQGEHLFRQLNERVEFQLEALEETLKRKINQKLQEKSEDLRRKDLRLQRLLPVTEEEVPNGRSLGHAAFARVVETCKNLYDAMNPRRGGTECVPEPDALKNRLERFCRESSLPIASVARAKREYETVMRVYNHSLSKVQRAHSQRIRAIKRFCLALLENAKQLTQEYEKKFTYLYYLHRRGELDNTTFHEILCLPPSDPRLQVEREVIMTSFEWLGEYSDAFLLDLPASKKVFKDFTNLNYYLMQFAVLSNRASAFALPPEVIQRLERESGAKEELETSLTSFLFPSVAKLVKVDLSRERNRDRLASVVMRAFPRKAQRERRSLSPPTDFVREPKKCCFAKLVVCCS